VPKTDDDFLVFSWNIEKKTLGVFDREADTVPLIVGGIADTLVGASGESRPFVGFLMEVKGTAQSVGKMCELLQTGFKAAYGADAKFEARPTGGSSYTREWMIVASQGLDVKVEDLPARDEIKLEIEHDANQATLKATEHNKKIADRGLRKRNDATDRQVTRWRANKRGEDEFRNGVVAAFEHGGKQYRIGSIHAPGPEIMESFPGALPAIQRAAANANVDLMSGDFNKHGDFDETIYKDIGKADEGTTFKKSKPNKLGKSRRDRTLVRKTTDIEATMRSPVAIVRPGAPTETPFQKRKRQPRTTARFTKRKVKAAGNKWKRLTDHAMIVTEVRPRPAVVPGAGLLAGQPPTTGEAAPTIPPESPLLMPGTAAAAALETPPTAGEARLTTPTEPPVSPLETPTPMEF